MPSRTFHPPGPGSWSLDTGRFPRPATAFTAEVFPAAAAEGFTAATAPYGLLLSLVEWRFVHGWAYLSPRPVAPLDDVTDLSADAWADLVASHPPLARRLEVSAAVFDRRPWRGEVARWEQRLKPALVRAHRRLQSVDPSSLSTDALAAHLGRSAANLRRAVALHHRFNVTPVVAVGDLLVHAAGWAGAPPADVLEAVTRTDRLEEGASAELAAVADAVRRDPQAEEVVTDSRDEPETTLSWLRSHPGVSRAVGAYLDLVGHWSAGAGNDIADPTLLETPSVLLALVCGAVERVRSGGRRPADDAAARVRAAVPVGRRARFDEMLAEARAVHPLRDERAVYTDVWANGLMRRAVLAAGARLCDAGVVDDPHHLLEATGAEMRSLVSRRGGPTAEELAGRARQRAAATLDDVPAQLGGSPRGPVAVEWLPPGAARTERAFRTYLAAMSSPEQPQADGAELRGVAASRGVHEGRARIVTDPSRLGQVQAGDVLVTEAVTPAFNVALPLVGAVVAERGGVLSHGAIVAREYGIPAVVGAAGATRRIGEGRKVRVDGDAGVVTLL